MAIRHQHPAIRMSYKADRRASHQPKLETLMSEGESGSALSSTELAEIIIDALLRAGMINDSEVRRAIRIAAEEIEVRKALGDYSATGITGFPLSRE